MEKQQEKDYIYITDDEGNEDKFEIIYQFDHEENQYMLVIPVDLEEDEEEVEVFAFRFEEDKDGVKLHTIEDESEWDMIEEVFNTLNDEFNQ